MSDEQFKNLDDVMAKHAPSTARELKPLSLPSGSPHWMKGLALGATALVVVTVFQYERMKSRTDSILALNETMSWDATSDEFPAEVVEDLEEFDI